MPRTDETAQGRIRYPLFAWTRGLLCHKQVFRSCIARAIFYWQRQKWRAGNSWAPGTSLKRRRPTGDDLKEASERMLVQRGAIRHPKSGETDGLKRKKGCSAWAQPYFALTLSGG